MWPAGAGGSLEGRCLDGHPDPRPRPPAAGPVTQVSAHSVSARPHPESRPLPRSETESQASLKRRCSHSSQSPVRAAPEDWQAEVSQSERRGKPSLRLELSLSLARGLSDRVLPGGVCVSQNFAPESPGPEHEPGSTAGGYVSAGATRSCLDGGQRRPASAPPSSLHTRCRAHSRGFEGQSKPSRAFEGLACGTSAVPRAPTCSLPAPVSLPSPQIKPVT